MINYNCEDFPSHKELFDKYPWLRKKNRIINRKVYINAIKNKPCIDCGLNWHPVARAI